MSAQPADPERALAELERLRTQDRPFGGPEERFRWMKMVEAMSWLLPLARAGLHADALEHELEVRLLDESEKYEALEREFDACVRVLARLTEIDVLSTDGVTYRLTASSVAAIALAQPLAAAVLRSPEPATKPRPKVVVFCGSSRFVAQMAVLMWEYEKAGRIAMGLHLLPAEAARRPDGSVIDHHLAEEQGVAAQMDELHLRKIDLADEVFVVNVGGYIGDSSRREIAYATAHGKRVVYLEDAAPEPATRADGGA